VGFELQNSEGLFNIYIHFADTANQQHYNPPVAVAALRDSPLYTRGPFFFVCYAKPSLHGGSFIFVLARHAPGVRETNFRI